MVFRPSRSGIPIIGSALRPNHARPSTARTSATPSMPKITPSRTPNRSSSKDRNTMMPMAAPVDDKMFVHAQTQEVMNKLAENDEFSELLQKGLKSMTHKQFIMILQHLLKPIVGNIVLDGSNYVEYMHNFLIMMEYPYSINKSLLKTPSAPHSINGVIILLAWLTEFTLKESEDEPLIQYCATDDLDTPPLSKMFMEKAAEAFSLWNSQQEVESEEVLKQIRQTYIEEKMGAGADVDTEIDRLKKSISDLKKETKPISLQNQFAEKRNEMKSLRQDCDNYAERASEASAQIKTLKAELKRKQAVKANVSLELSALREKLSRQKMTLKEKNSVLLEISEAKSVLAANKQTALELSEASGRNEIKLSLLTQKKFQLIEMLNNTVYKVASDLEIAGWEEEFDPSVFEIKTSSLGDTSGLKTEIQRLDRGFVDLKHKYENAMNSLKTLGAELEAERKDIIDKDNNFVNEIELLEILIKEAGAEDESAETELQILSQSNVEICRRFEAEIEEIESDNRILEENIAKFREINPRLVSEQKAFQESSLQKVKKYYNKRKQEVQEQRKKNAEMRKFLNEFNRINQPFPEDVQKTIDEVMAKRNAEKK